MADRKELTIYTLHRSHTYVLDRLFNGRQKRVNYLHNTQKSYIVLDRQFNGRQKRVNYIHTTHNSYIRAGQTIQRPTEKCLLSTHYTEVINTCRTENSMADRKELTIYTLHRSHTYVLDRQFNGRQKRVNYLHTTQKSYIRAGQTIQWPIEKS